jgi:peptidoglycan/xylan/chitin deacetylase (PgdA/CDA1 family)
MDVDARRPELVEEGRLGAGGIQDGQDRDLAAAVCLTGRQEAHDALEPADVAGCKDVQYGASEFAVRLSRQRGHRLIFSGFKGAQPGPGLWRTMTQRPVSVVVTIDTEEDNWFPARDGLTVENIRGVPRLQAILDRHGIRPTYLTTYQVVVRPWAAALLAEIHHSGRGEVGTHLHPWNTPPLHEPFSPENTSLRKLPSELQREKLDTITSVIRSATGIEPTAFRAGRWSVSPSVIRTLTEAGYRTDSSVLPYVFWPNVGDGPSFHRVPAGPYRLDGLGNVETHVPHGPVVEVQPTVGFTRWPWTTCGPLLHALRARALRPLHLPGVLARVGALDCIPLSPEATSLEQMRRVTTVALRNGLDTLNLFFHSGALMPGKSPFVNSAEQLEEFLRRIDSYFTFLAAQAPIRSLTLSELGEQVRGTKTSAEQPGLSVAI